MAKKEVDGEGLNIPNRIKRCRSSAPADCGRSDRGTARRDAHSRLDYQSATGLAHRLEVPVQRERA